MVYNEFRQGNVTGNFSASLMLCIERKHYNLDYIITGTKKILLVSDNIDENTNVNLYIEVHYMPT